MAGASAADRVTVGRILGPHGTRGEMKVEPLTDNAGRFRPGARLLIGDDALTVASAREAGRYVYLRFEGHADRTSVELLRNRALEITESALPPLPEGEYYRHELIGLGVVDAEGRTLGTLEQVLETGANDVYLVRTPSGGELPLPAVPEVVVSVDVAGGRMVVSPPGWV